MKTKEFVETIGDLGYLVQLTNTGKSAFIFDKELNKRICQITLETGRFISYKNRPVNKDVLKVVSDYLNTPLEDREDEKKYNIVLWEHNSKSDFRFASFSKGSDGNTIVDRSTSVEKLQDSFHQYNQSEIDQLIEDKPEFADVIRAAMREVK